MADFPTDYVPPKRFASSSTAYARTLRTTFACCGGPRIGATTTLAAGLLLHVTPSMHFLTQRACQRLRKSFVPAARTAMEISL